MLNLFDDFPIHQTAEPLAHPATSDRNFYDRSWFNGYSPDGEYMFGLGLAVYPHRQIQDCAFSVRRRGEDQHCLFGSRRASPERSDMAVGPFRLEVAEPMRRARLVIENNETGISADLTFTARTGAIQEGRQTFYAGTRALMDATRFAQFGNWEGTIAYPGGEVTVAAQQCLGTKDRSWGVRLLGEPETGGPPREQHGNFFLWAPLIWDDHVSHAVFFDYMDGRALFREALTSPFYPMGTDVPAPHLTQVNHLATARHRIVYRPGTRHAKSAELDLIDHDGGVRTITMEPLLKFQMKGLGYIHPTWNQGMWQGENALAYERFNPDSIDPLMPENIHIQQVVRLSDGQRHGTGVLEQMVFGPYAPGGFSQFLDGAA